MRICGFKGSIVMNKDGMFCLLPCAYDGGHIIRNKGVSRGLWWDGERGAPGGGICCRGLNQADEVVGAILIVGDAKEERVQDLAEGGEVVVGGLPHDGWECGGCSGKACHDLFWGHGGG